MDDERYMTERDVEEEMDEELDRLAMGGIEVPNTEDVIVDVSFGDPEDDDAETHRVINWVASFSPGHYQKQVADLFLSEGEIYVMMDKLSVTIPLFDMLQLLERGGIFEKKD